MSNAYASPTADMSADTNDSGSYEPQVFALKGRIGRLRYLAYSFGLMLLAGVPFFVLSIVMDAGKMGDQAVNYALLSYVPMFAVSILMAIRRLNDMDMNGWLSVLGLIPLVNFFFGLWLLLGRGSLGVNRYGPAPVKNSGGLIAAAYIISAVMLIGILAAIAVPAYQAYMAKDRAAQQAAQQGAPLPSDSAVQR